MHGVVSPGERVRVFSVVQETILTQTLLGGDFVEEFVFEGGAKRDAALGLVLEHV